jgi:hypothetical protein
MYGNASISIWARSAADFAVSGMPRIPVVADVRRDKDANVNTYLREKLPHLATDVSHLRKPKEKGRESGPFFESSACRISRHLR